MSLGVHLINIGPCGLPYRGYLFKCSRVCFGRGGYDAPLAPEEAGIGCFHARILGTGNRVAAHEAEVRGRELIKLAHNPALHAADVRNYCSLPGEGEYFHGRFDYVPDVSRYHYDFRAGNSLAYIRVAVVDYLFPERVADGSLVYIYAGYVRDHARFPERPCEGAPDETETDYGDLTEFSTLHVFMTFFIALTNRSFSSGRPIVTLRCVLSPYPPTGLTITPSLKSAL